MNVSMTDCSIDCADGLIKYLGEPRVETLNPFVWCFVGMVFLIGLACLSIVSNYFAVKRLKNTTKSPRLAFSKAAFFEPKARMLGVEYTWIRFDGSAGKTTVKRLSKEGALVEKTIDDQDGELARQFVQRLDEEQWIRISSGLVNSNTWDSYHQRKGRVT